MVSHIAHMYSKDHTILSMEIEAQTSARVVYIHPLLLLVSFRVRVRVRLG